MAFEPENAPGTCLKVSGNVLDQAGCNQGDASQSFTFGGAATSGADNTGVNNPGTTSTLNSVTVSPTSTATSTTQSQEPNPATTSQVPSPSSTQDVSVARAGGVLNPEAAAEANVRDDTATRAFSSVPLKSSSGQCLSIDPTAGDFRENLIPVQLKGCDGSANQKFDIITAGKHISQPNSMLVVSTVVRFVR